MGSATGLLLGVVGSVAAAIARARGRGAAGAGQSLRKLTLLIWPWSKRCLRFSSRSESGLKRGLPWWLRKLRAFLGLDQVGDVGAVEGGADLGVEVDAIDHDQHGRVLSLGCRRSFCAANTISRDLPEPWKCQIRPFFG